MASPSKLHILVISAQHLAAEIRSGGHKLPDYSEGSLFVISETDQVGVKTGNLINIMSDARVDPTRMQFKSSPLSFGQVSAREVPALEEVFEVKRVLNLSEAMRRLAEDRNLAGRDMHAARYGTAAGASAAAIA